MIRSSLQHQEDIRYALEGLGFEQSELLLSKMEPCEDPKDPAIKSIILGNLPIEINHLADMGLFIKEGAHSHWYIDQIIVTLQLVTERRAEGFIELQRRYRTQEGSLPPLSQVRADVRQMIGEESQKEKVFLQINLKKELEELGFGNYYELLRSARPEAGFTVLETIEPTNPGGRGQYPLARFEFVLSQPDPALAATIWMVRASLVETGMEKPRLVYEAEQGFYRMNGTLPHKQEMIAELLTSARLLPDPYETVRKRFRMAEETGRDCPFRQLSQGKLRL
jgi:hypothetical protein